MQRIIDLHAHTYYSDGGLSPRNLVKKAKQAGLSALSITDHDTVAGLQEGLEASRTEDIEVVPGCEFSTDYLDNDIHILAYYLDYQDEGLLKVLRTGQIRRENKAKQIIEGFQKLGYKVEYEEVLETAKGSVGRPHIAAKMISNPQNKKRLKEEFGQEVTDVQFLFQKYLGRECEFYKQFKGDKDTLETPKAIKLIHKLGGLAVLAHPAWDLTAIREGRVIFLGDELIQELAKSGLDGVEAICYRENKEVAQFIITHYERLAKELGLLITGGSDFHAFNNVGRSLGLKEENIPIEYDLLTRMKAKLEVVKD